MPRTGITEDQMNTAIQALQERGEAVTKNSVRRELGNTGSFGTIQAFLQSWRMTQAVKEPPEEITTVPESVQSHFARVWALAMTTAQADLAPRREALEQEAVRLRSVMAQTQAENDEAIRMLEIQNDMLSEQIAEAKTKDQVAQARVAELADALGYHRARLESQEAQAAHDLEALAERDARIAELEARAASSTRGCKLFRRWVRGKPLDPGERIQA